MDGRGTCATKRGGNHFAFPRGMAKLYWREWIEWSWVVNARNTMSWTIKSQSNTLSSKELVVLAAGDLIRLLRDMSVVSYSYFKASLCAKQSRAM
jgi:hypothetical protein